MILAALIFTGLQMPDAQFNARIDQLIAQSGGPGASAIVLKEGKPIYLKAFGLADKDKQTKFTTRTAFEVGSISKQFVGASILLLVKDKKLSIGDKLGKHLPEIPETWKNATIEQTLHHMSGIPDYEEIAGYDFYNAERTEADIIAEASKKPLDFQPGEKFSYSNTGYFLLSMIVTRASGTPVGKFLEEKIFAPLGMTETYAQTIPTRPIAATGYHNRSGKQTAQPRIAWSSTLGAGGIVSTLNDITRWDQALDSDKLLPDALRNQLWSTAKFNDGKPNPYGFGWFSDSYRDIPRQNHSGQTNGFTCFYLRFPSKKVTVFTVTNTYGGRVGPVANALAAHFVPGASFQSWAKLPDSDKKATHLAMLKQAVLGEGGHDLLSEGIKNFATNKDFDAMRAELKPFMTDTGEFQLLKEKVTNPENDTREYTYRLDSKAGTRFWVFRVTAGKMGFLTWGDE